MDSDPNNLSKALKKIQELEKRQEEMSREMEAFQQKLSSITKEESISTKAEKPLIPQETKPNEAPKTAKERTNLTKKLFPSKSSLETFIGENLVNKIGIIITIIGVSIGVKYSFDHDLVTPIVRVIGGYAIGIALLLVALKLRKNYEKYSAVLLSGGMAILYFITFASYSFYGFLSVPLAFTVMVLFTILTVVAALSYDQQVIALIGMVGAYAVPFLLGDESGDPRILFGYTAVINVGILAIAVYRYWKIMYHSAFACTWLIFGYWFSRVYGADENFGIAMLFSSLFYLLFYATFLSNKLLNEKQFRRWDVVYLLLNAFIFYWIGYISFDENETYRSLLGMFTFTNALLHGIIALVLYSRSIADRNVLFLIIGLAITFFTITIPVQLHAQWITLLWITEASVLIWIGRTKGVSFYESLGYPLIIFGFGSLVVDWAMFYPGLSTDDPAAFPITVWNVQFLSSGLFSILMGYILSLTLSNKYEAPKYPGIVKDLLQLILPGILLLATYFMFELEISNAFERMYAQSKIEIETGLESETILYDEDILDLKFVWIVNYSIVFALILSVLNVYLFRSARFARFNLLLNLLMLLVFLMPGLQLLGDLRDAYLARSTNMYYDAGISYLLLRYLSMLLVGLVLVASERLMRIGLIDDKRRPTLDIMVHVTILWTLSGELIHWLTIAKVEDKYKLGISILWGAYAVIMIIFGIWQKRTYLRIFAIVVFAITLIKLFVYDVAHLATLPKTILFVSLGVLLLIISFLYNKYRHIIREE